MLSHQNYAFQEQSQHVKYSHLQGKFYFGLGPKYLPVTFTFCSLTEQSNPFPAFQIFSISLTHPTNHPHLHPNCPSAPPSHGIITLPSPCWLLSYGCWPCSLHLTKGSAHAGRAVQVQSDGSRNEQNDQQPRSICYLSSVSWSPLMETHIHNNSGPEKFSNRDVQ